MSAPDGTIRVLALSPIPIEGAGCRFRIAQFIPYLASVGIDVTLSSLFTSEFFQLADRPGQYLRKAGSFMALSLKQLDSLRDLSSYDVIFLYREFLPLGPAIAEWLLSWRKRPKMVFDFDDAIFLPSVSDANRLISVLKFPGKAATIARCSDHVIVGNEYLAQYARRFNSAVTVIPTCVDTTRFVPRAPATVSTADGRLVVGWIGSPTTAQYIASLASVLQQVSARHPIVLRISGAPEPVRMPGVTVENVPWSLDREVELFNACDIGVYPLADDEWSKGKCGFKAIEFMACGVPVVAAAVGVNRDIIRDGVNGFLASSEPEWVNKLERLIVDPALKTRLAAAGRETVEHQYSLRVNAPRLAATLRAVASEPVAG